MKPGSRTLWDDDLLQFSRLLAEINAIDLTHEQHQDLCASMDLEPHQLNELFERAQQRFEQTKQHLPGLQPGSLVQDIEHGEDYDLVEAGAWIGVHDPECEDGGIDVRLRTTSEDLTIEVWPKNELAHPEGPLEPTSTHRFAFADARPDPSADA